MRTASGLTASFPLSAAPHLELGPGALSRLGMWAARLGSKAMVVTDPGLSTTGTPGLVASQLDAAGVPCFIFDQVSPNPSVADVEAGLAAGGGRGVDLVVSVGGGSVHDCAKTIALVASNGGKVVDYEGFDRSRHPAVPLIAVNTTAGSGAEMSRFAVITDPARGVKMILADRHLLPLVAVEDPELTVSMPPAVTAASGMDALTHAVEAHVSTAATDFTRLLSRRAAEVITAALPVAFKDGSDLEARWDVLYGSMLAAYAFNSASVGAVHALAHQLGGKLGLVHGVCNAVLLPVVSAFNAETSPDGYADLAPVLGVGGRGAAAARGVVDRLRRISAQLGIPHRLRDLGVDQDEIPELARLAMADMCLDTNPRPLTESEVAELYRRAW